MFQLATQIGTNPTLEQLQIVEGQNRAPVMADRQVWKPPQVGYFKCNVDVAFVKERGRMGVGIVVRNLRGEVHAVLAAPKSATKSVLVAEGTALLRAVILCHELGLIFMWNWKGMPGR